MATDEMASYEHLPSPPMPRLTAYGAEVAQSLAETQAAVASQLAGEESARQASFSATKALQAEVTAASLAMRNGDLEGGTLPHGARGHLDAAYALLDGMTSESSEALPAQPERPAAIAALLEEMVSIHAFLDFFKTGRLLSKSALRPCFDDSEYIGGCLAFASELNDYCVGRAMHRDVRSVTHALGVVSALHGQLLAFDFRNGPLRRKYDGLKYGLKRCEELLFEQSLLQGDDRRGGGGESECQGGGAAKRPRGEAAGDQGGGECGVAPPGPCLVDEACFRALRLGFEEADGAREAVIKGCRDGQKLSKLAIYSVHRGQLDKATAQLKEAAAKTRSLLPLVEAHPTLRQGSFANVLEEYAEACLFLHFMQTRQVARLGVIAVGEAAGASGGGEKEKKEEEEEEKKGASGGVSSDGSGAEALLTLLVGRGGEAGGGGGGIPGSGAAVSACAVGAYLGGLVDLTGELGRFAVLAGTQRKATDVAQCFEATCAIATLLGGLPPSGSLRKKGGAVAANLRKMRQVQYELALAQAGRLSRAPAVDTAAPPPSADNGGGGGGENS